MTIFQAVLLFLAAFLGGALNSVAGGGSFLSFPALLFTGVPAVNANVTSTIALWPGSVASVGAYRAELTKAERVRLLGSISLVGGVLGSVLLLHTKSSTFLRVLPYLLLMATLLFTFGGTLTSWVRARMGHSSAADASPMSVAGVSLLQFVISIYGGYFGGGIGILMLASLAIMGMENIHSMNAIKTLLASLINGVAVLVFVISGAVFWPQAALMVVAAMLGGYGGAHYAQQLNPKLVRRFVICVGLLMTAYFFYRAYATV